MAAREGADGLRVLTTLSMEVFMGAAIRTVARKWMHTEV